MAKIAVLYGGTSSERDVSIQSGEFVYKSIDETKFDKDFFVFPEDKDKFIEKYAEYDLAIPVFHWIDGEDGQIFAFLNTLGVKSLYSDFSSHLICLNKNLTNSMLRKTSLNTIPSHLCQNIKQFEQLSIKGKIFIKPNQWGSSIDTGIFDNLQEAKDLVKQILKYDDVIVQKYIPIDREFSVSVFGDYNKQPQVAGITEIITKRDYFDYKAKYDLDQTREVTPADVDKKLEEQLKEQSLKVYKIFELKTLSRIDYIFHNDEIYFLEVNTIPWFTGSSLFPQALRHFGLNVTDFFSKQINQKLDS